MVLWVARQPRGPVQHAQATQAIFMGQAQNRADEFFHPELVMQVAAADDALRARFDVVLAMR